MSVAHCCANCDKFIERNFPFYEFFRCSILEERNLPFGRLAVWDKVIYRSAARLALRASGGCKKST